jgi:hypothetical protein
MGTLHLQTEIFGGYSNLPLTPNLWWTNSSSPNGKLFFFLCQGRAVGTVL